MASQRSGTVREDSTAMKIILTQDVEKLGTAGTMQEVKPGYARNYLIPKGFAQLATPGLVKEMQVRQAAEQRRIAKQEVEMQSLADRISGLRLEFTARAGESGRLFGSVTSADIAEKLTAELGQEVDRRKVDLPHGLHEVGEFPVTIRLVGRLNPQITAVVVPEGGAPAAEVAAAAPDEAATEDASEPAEDEEAETGA
jgi:large subunit ribosomal protein L9